MTLWTPHGAGSATSLGSIGGRGRLFSMERSAIPKDIPDAPGVYQFYRNRELLYVGKATSLRDRVRSYFSLDLIVGRGPKIAKMIADATMVRWEETESVLEALILEAQLIKKHQPPANTRDRDNKSFNYLVITKEAYPRVLVVRGRELLQSWNDTDILHLFGPFPQGGILREALGIVRKIFPFRDKCAPGATRGCFNKELGLCPGVCDGSISREEYKQTIKHIATLFSGKKSSLVKDLMQLMEKASQEERFEDAAKINKQIYALTHIRDVALIKRERTSDGGASFRIEAYDVAHTAGTSPVGVMVVVQDGEPETRSYRTFTIRTVGNDDMRALSEILERRLGHPEWPYPQLMVVDGGAIQKQAAERLLKKHGVMIPVVAVTKDEHHKPRDVVGPVRYVRPYEKDILLANAEAHRFAIGRHRKKRTKASLGKLTK